MTKEIVTPHDIISELARIRQESERGIALLAEKEAEAVRLELEADTAQAKALLQAQGTVADREAGAKLACTQARFNAALARVEVNRIKLKLKHLSEAMMAVQTSARMVELQWKTAGVGER